MVQPISITFHKSYGPLKPFTALFAIFIFITAVPGQASNRNNPYVPSPEVNPKEIQSRAASQSGPIQATLRMQGQTTQDPLAIAQSTFKTAKASEKRSILPSEIYKAGVGDVLFVYLRNAPHGSCYCTIQADGTIDFPLAGENLIVTDLTVGEIANKLASGVKLYADPRIEVKVSSYASHKITVLGMVEDPGDRSLLREAVPFFVIRSSTVVGPKATRVTVKRTFPPELQSYELDSPAADNVLIYPGDTIEFTSDSKD